MPPYRHAQAQALEVDLQHLDEQFRPLRCLGHGTSASTFLAETQSGCKVALKMLVGDNDDAEQAQLQNELQVLRRLGQQDETGQNRDSAIAYVSQQIMNGPQLTGLVLQFVQGGTLGQEIESKAGQGPYAERRIASYAYQLVEALAFCHEKNVHHCDIKSDNVLIDRSKGDKLILCDFGCAIGRYEAPLGFTRDYAAPELVEAETAAAMGRRVVVLDAVKLDSYGLKCILLELLCCRKIAHINGKSPDYALPWIAYDAVDAPIVGYSQCLKQLVDALGETDPSKRASPAELVEPFVSQDHRSPLLADHLTAARRPISGEPTTVDNVQLGMLVQPGSDWEGPSDVGANSIGVITELRPDGTCLVGWATQPENVSVCHVGAQGKYCLQVGPTLVKDYTLAPVDPTIPFDLQVDISSGMCPMKTCGIIENVDARGFQIGQPINPHCMIVGKDERRARVFAAPTAVLCIPSKPRLPTSPTLNAGLRPYPDIPSTWEGNALLPEVKDDAERQMVLGWFHSSDEGLVENQTMVTSIKRVQSRALWLSYAERRAIVSLENWGMSNERRCFHGTGINNPENIVQGTAAVEYAFGNLRRDPGLLKAIRKGLAPNGAYNEVFDRAIVLTDSAQAADRNAYSFLDPGCPLGSRSRQIVLCRVVSGRGLPLGDNGECHIGSQRLVRVNKHSESPDCGRKLAVLKASQILPEYIITYQCTTTRSMAQSRESFGFPAAASAPPSKTDGLVGKVVQPSPSKLCVVCLANPVSYVLVPCGHPNLCHDCATAGGLARLNLKCPECRQDIQQATRLFGRVLDV